MKWVHRIRFGACPQCRLISKAIVGNDTKGAMMLDRTDTEVNSDEDHGGDGPTSSPEQRFTRSYFPIRQAEDPGHDQAGQQSGEDDRLQDESNIQGVPSRVERKEGTDTIVIGPIHENVAECSQQTKQPQNTPARGEDRRLVAETMPKPNDASNGESDEGSTEEGVRDPAMMLKARDWPAKTPEDIHVRSLGCQGHAQRCVSGPTIEASTRETGSGKKMSDGFHIVVIFNRYTSGFYNARYV